MKRLPKLLFRNLFSNHSKYTRKQPIINRLTIQIMEFYVPEIWNLYLEININQSIQQCTKKDPEHSPLTKLKLPQRKLTPVGTVIFPKIYYGIWKRMSVNQATPRGALTTSAPHRSKRWRTKTNVSTSKSRLRRRRSRGSKRKSMRSRKFINQKSSCIISTS